MKILRLIPVLDFGGVESRFVMQASEWTNPEISIEYCTFWKPGAAAAKLRALGATVHVLNQNPSIRNFNASAALLHLARALKPDVIHSSIGEANFHNMVISKLGQWKCIIEEAGIPDRTLRNRLVHSVLYRAADRIIAVSQASADYVIQREWAPRSRVQVIPNAIRPEFFTRQRGERATTSVKLFRAVGRLTAVKNYPMLIRAFAHAHKANPNIRLEIIGEGEDRPVLETLIHSLSANSFITLRGFVSDIAALHDDTDFFLMPSLSEGFGLAAAEPMALGIPGLGSRVGGLPSVFGDLGDQWLLPPSDTHTWAANIGRLAAMNATEYSFTAQQFAARASAFSPRRYVGQLEKLYSGCLK